MLSLEQWKLIPPRTQGMRNSQYVQTSLGASFEEMVLKAQPLGNESWMEIAAVLAHWRGRQKLICCVNFGVSIPRRDIAVSMI